MIYLKYIIFLPFDIVMKIIGVLLAPFFSFFVDENGNLPDWLYWFTTPDSNMFGMYGDAGFYDEYRDLTHTPLGRWWVCTLWQWRNTSQGFSTFCLGVYDQALDVETIWESGSGDLAKYLKVAKKGSAINAWEFKGAFKWPFAQKRFRWRMGWKLGWHGKLPAQYVFSISPFMSLSEE